MQFGIACERACNSANCLSVLTEVQGAVLTGTIASMKSG
jgi:hypothetical protein